VQDITERKEAEEVLRRYKSDLERIVIAERGAPSERIQVPENIRGIPSLHVVFDYAARAVLMVNGRFTEKLGYSGRTSRTPTRCWPG
jgi:PAS domain-containing protein